MRITTKRGDGGATQTCKGKLVPKCDLRVRASGALDEVISFLGLAKAKAKDAFERNTIDSIQADLFRIIAQIAAGDKALPSGDRKAYPVGKVASEGASCLKNNDVTRIENIGNIIERSARMPSGFIVPGANEQSAILQIARTVTRRAECVISELNGKQKINPCILAYLNRLSDLLFVMAVREEGNPQVLKK